MTLHSKGCNGQVLFSIFIYLQVELLILSLVWFFFPNDKCILIYASPLKLLNAYMCTNVCIYGIHTNAMYGTSGGSPPPPSLIWGSWSAPGNNLQWIIFQIIFRISSQVGKFWSQVDLLTRTNSLVCICQVLYGRKAFLVCKDSQKFKQTTLCKMKIIINIKSYY